jgi:hypothetical protein
MANIGKEGCAKGRVESRKLGWNKTRGRGKARETDLCDAVLLSEVGVKSIL